MEAELLLPLSLEVLSYWWQLSVFQKEQKAKDFFKTFQVFVYSALYQHKLT